MARSDPFSLDCQHLRVWAGTDTAAAVNAPLHCLLQFSAFSLGCQEHFIDCALGNLIRLNGYVLAQNKW